MAPCATTRALRASTGQSARLNDGEYARSRRRSGRRNPIMTRSERRGGVTGKWALTRRQAPVLVADSMAVAYWPSTTAAPASIGMAVHLKANARADDPA